MIVDAVDDCLLDEVVLDDVGIDDTVVVEIGDYRAEHRALSRSWGARRDDR